MTAAAEFDFARAASRLYRWMWVVASAGVAATWWQFAWQAALGFALGAAFSALNFWWFHRLVKAIGDNSGGRRRGASAVFLGLRYLLFAALAYATLKYFEASFRAALAGCFVAAAAVLLEIFYQLIYAP